MFGKGHLIKHFSTVSTYKSNNILVINCGSSSVKFQIIDPVDKCTKISGIAERLDTPKAVIKFKSQYIYNKQTIPIENFNHKKTCDQIYDLIKDFDIKAIGHRVVHGGEKFKRSAIIDEAVKLEIKQLFPLGTFKILFISIISFKQ